jgi:hypothetical protein
MPAFSVLCLRRLACEIAAWQRELRKPPLYPAELRDRDPAWGMASLIAERARHRKPGKRSYWTRGRGRSGEEPQARLNECAGVRRALGPLCGLQFGRQREALA